MQTIGSHFPESGIARIIHEYSMEYDSKELYTFFRDTEGIFFDNGMNLLTIDYYYNDNSIMVDVRHGSGRLIKCDPNEVPNKLKMLYPEDIAEQVTDKVGHDDMIHIITGLGIIADNLRSDLIFKCRHSVPHSPKTWADLVRAWPM